MLGRCCAGRRRSLTAPVAAVQWLRARPLRIDIAVAGSLSSPSLLALFIFRSAQPLRGSLAAQRGSLVLTGIGGGPHRRPARSNSGRHPAPPGSRSISATSAPPLLCCRVGGNQGIPGGSGYQPGNRPRSWLPPVTRRGLGLILGPTGQSSPPGNHRSLVPKPGNRAGSWFPKKNYPQPCVQNNRGGGPELCQQLVQG